MGQEAAEGRGGEKRGELTASTTSTKTHTGTLPSPTRSSRVSISCLWSRTIRTSRGTG